MRLSFLVFLAVLVQFVHAPRANAAHHARPPETVQVGGFSPSIFKFVVTRPDDGKDKAGGWQEAVATMNFSDGRQLPTDRWTCTIKVGMPIRPENYGVISSAVAASMSAAAATTASKAVMHRRPMWIAASYCIHFAKEVQLTLNTTWSKLGARVWRL
jgi:hypothetical protein